MSIFNFKRKSSFDLVVVGLGNPGSKYSETKHNIGYKIIDFISSKCNAQVKRLRHYALTGKCYLDGSSILLVKPQTFMNNSGASVKDILEYYKLPAEKVLIIFDDVMLKPGTIRIKRSGSDGGHNGIKSIISSIGSDFPRIKVGVGNSTFASTDLADYVLSDFGKEDFRRISSRFNDIMDAVALIAGDEIEKAMNLFNQSK